MGTRSITHLSLVRDGIKTRIVSFYRHYDGYPECHGLQMAKFLAGFPEKAPSYDNRAIGNCHNGADDLMLQLLAVLKMEQGPYNLYLVKLGSSNMGEEYVYDVCFDDRTAEATIQIRPEYKMVDAFSGSPQELIERFAPKEEETDLSPVVYEDGVGY